VLPSQCTIWYSAVVEYSLSAAAHAPPEVVWRLFIDVERWPQMTRSIRNVRRLDTGPLRVGSEALVIQPRLPPTRWRITELDPETGFVWEADAGGIRTTGGHFVRVSGDGCIVTLTIAQRGFLIGIVDVLFGNLMRRYLAMELEGFRLTAESSNSSNTSSAIRT
jgi:uncharacterized membrane protein